MSIKPMLREDYDDYAQADIEAYHAVREADEQRRAEAHAQALLDMRNAEMGVPVVKKVVSFPEAAACRGIDPTFFIQMTFMALW